MLDFIGAPEEIRTPDPQIRSLMDHTTPRSRSPYARGSRSLPARGHPIERRGPSRPNAIVSAIDGGLTNSAAVQDSRDERPVVSALVHARILDSRWTHPALWIQPIDIWRSLGDSNPCFRRERALLASGHADTSRQP
jgi:hypothetical protein